MCDKKVPTKMKLLIYQTVIRPTLLYGCETWPMSVKDEKRLQYVFLNVFMMDCDFDTGGVKNQHFQSIILGGAQMSNQ